ncbi:MAG: hypothetical protein ACTHKP_08540 [Nitrososphaeraceae archaeon]
MKIDIIRTHSALVSAPDMPFMLMPTLSCAITTYTEIASFSLIQFPTYVGLELATQALEHDV